MLIRLRDQSSQSSRWRLSGLDWLESSGTNTQGRDGQQRRRITNHKTNKERAAVFFPSQEIISIPVLLQPVLHNVAPWPQLQHPAYKTR